MLLLLVRGFDRPAPFPPCYAAVDALAPQVDAELSSERDKLRAENLSKLQVGGCACTSKLKLEGIGTHVARPAHNAALLAAVNRGGEATALGGGLRGMPSCSAMDDGRGR